ncbi:MAG: hypothetical protein ABW195_16295, partial [Ilumatobacteraceae bacterium]
MTARSILRRPTLAVLAAGVLLLGACGGSDDDDDGSAAADGGVSVTDVWARTTPPGTTVGAVYLTASSAAADALVGVDVEASIAAAAMRHST